MTTFVRADAIAQIENPLRWNSLNEALAGIMSIAVKIGGIVAVFFFVWTGWKFIAAQGKKEDISKAKDQLMWTVVGTLLLLGADIVATLITNSINTVTKIK